MMCVRGAGSFVVGGMFNVFCAVCITLLGLSAAHAIQFRADTRTGATPEEACESFATSLYGRLYWRVVGSCSIYQESTNNLWINACNTATFYCQGANNSIFTQNVVNSPGFQYRTNGCVEGTVFDPSTGQCIAPPCEVDVTLSSGYYQYGTQPDDSFPSYVCINGCAATFSGSVPQARALIDGTYHYFALGSYDGIGEECTSGPVAPGSSSSLPQDSCASGQQSGTVNGKLVCLNEQGQPISPYAPKITQTTENVTVTENPDGSVTTTTVTNNFDGSSITTTKIVYPDGSSSTTMEGVGVDDPLGEDQEAEGLCDQHPDVALCQEALKIDETGVPDEFESGDFWDSLEEKNNDLLEWFTDESSFWRISELGFGWNPPIPEGGSCQPWIMHEKEINICQPLGMIRDMWAWVIAMLAGLSVWISATRAIGGGK